MFLKSASLTSVILLSYLVFFGQSNFPYEKEWSLIDSLITKKNLPKSALVEVKKVYEAAKKEKNEAQWVRAIIYRNLLQQVDDRDINAQIREIENEIASAPVVVASLLKSTEAETLNQYFMEYGYQIRNRTTVIADTSADMTTWTGDHLSNKISSLYISSIQDTNRLIKTLNKNYDAILDTGNNRKLRPTLYDLLAWRALSYFQSSPDGIKSPADDSVKNNPAIFSDAGIFSKYILTGNEGRTGFIQSLLIYQQILRLHENDKSVDAVVDADIKRIQFVYQNAIYENKDSLYLKALKNIVGRFHESPVSTQAIYLQAEWWATEAQKYKPLTDSLHRYDYLKAIELCNEAIKYPSQNEGKSSCQVLRQNIKRQSFSLKTEIANLPLLPFRIQVTYKNINHLYNRIIRIDKSKRIFLDTRLNYPEYWSTLIRMPVTRKFEQIISETSDYQEHIVEIPCDGLEPGQYILLTSSDPDFSDTAVIGMTTFFSTSIAYIRNGNDYFVLDRDSGMPLPGVRVESLVGNKKHNTYQIDKNGHFYIPAEQYGTNVNLKFFYKNDFYYDEQYVYLTRNMPEEDEEDNESSQNQKTFEKRHMRDIIFSDRSIYRPGQTIYFKGLLVTQDFKTKRSKIVPQQLTTLFLKDVNNQKIDSLTLKSNDFGSLQGSFHIPQNLLNGEFKLYDNVTQTEYYFSVEEYKRPKFYVQFDTLRNSYAVGDTINIDGSAFAYAGNIVDGAKYSWTVIRASRFPYPWMLEKFPSRLSGQIGSGSGVTNENGKFNFRFVLAPDHTMTSEKRPVFDYLIEVRVTDDNGETRSETSSVSASYQSCEIVSSLPLKSTFSRDSLSAVPVTTTNAAGSFVKEELTVAMFSITGPDRLIRERYWEQSDQFLLTEKEYVKLFPYDEYKNESDFKTWKTGTEIFRKTDSTKENGNFTLDQKTKNLLRTGWYCIVFTVKDRNGEDIVDKKYVEIISNNEYTTVPSYNRIPEQNLFAQPGNSLIIETGTDAKNVHVIRSRLGLKDKLSYSYYDLNQNISQVTLNITEADRGGYSVQDAFVKNNRFYTSIHNIHVPWTNKDLNISYETWKDKILPGSQQQWKIRIAGNKTDKVFAEVMSVMYDASLDQIKPHSWSVPNLFPVFPNRDIWNAAGNFQEGNYSMREGISSYETPGYNTYDELIKFPLQSRRFKSMAFASAPMLNKMAVQDVVVAGYGGAQNESEDKELDSAKFEVDQKGEIFGSQTGSTSDGSIENIQIRKNFNETAFFQPDLLTDSTGSVEINFTVPEALTKWKWMVMANTKDLSMGYAEKMVVTQKELMVQTNMPRFFRQGDKMILPVKIANLSEATMTGDIHLEWMDAEEKNNQDKILSNTQGIQQFTVKAGQSQVVFFPVTIPTDYSQPVLYRITAKTNSTINQLSDGEQAILPVLSNRMLVTEALPLNMNFKTEKHFEFEKLLKSKTGGSLQNQSLTIEYTTNPVWNAVQALPYMMEFPYECAEQTFNRYYANAMAANIVKISPAIEAVFGKWKNTDTAELLSNLQKNEELKSVLIRETPWVLEAQNETQQKKNIALLFDIIKMQKALRSAMDKLKQMQNGDGGFVWFKGGNNDRYITQYIISGIGHLKKLKAISEDQQSALGKISRSAIQWLDGEIVKDYDRDHKQSSSEQLSDIQIQYLYMRSFFPEIAVPQKTLTAYNFYKTQSIRYWTKQSVYMQAMIALFLKRAGDVKNSKEILASLRENATQSEELGMYWWTVTNGYYWQQAPVETESALIETFTELGGSANDIEQMKLWLLQQKRTSHWPTTKATADACYALLLSGKDWISNPQSVKIQLGDYSINSDSIQTDAGTGYFKERIPGDKIKPDMGNIQVAINPKLSTVNYQLSTEHAQPSWGAVYWQYFEDLDKITPAGSSLNITRGLFIEKNTSQGAVLEAVSSNNVLKPGNKLVMRIIVKTDRDLEYVHLNDKRAACLEPANVLSGYQWQDGLGYYQSTKDESTSFFFDRLPKGTFVFEYPVFVTTAGDYSNGISTLECMYAPEFAAHSEGVRIHVESK